MSRLFSQLENIGHDRTDVEGPGADQKAASEGVPPASTQAAPHDLSAAPPLSTATSAQQARPDYTPSSTVHSQISGYAISSQLSLSSRPQPPAIPSRSSWPVRLWFVSLLALIGLSLAMLLAPRDDGTAVRPAAQEPAGMAATPAANVAPPPPLPAPSRPVKTPAIVEERPVAAAPADKPAARRQPAPAEQPATAPRAPAGDAGCSEAMAAMNLCSASPR